jgi:hypothetical protein
LLLVLPFAPDPPEYFVMPTPEVDEPPEAAVEELSAAVLPPLASTVEVLMK